MLPPLEEIGRRRRLLQLSQKELARLCNVSQSLIAKIEGGEANPSYLKTKSIFDLLESVERRKELRARDVLHTKVVGVQSHDSVAKGVKVMRETGYSQLPVLSGTQVVGSLTEKVILEKILSSAKPEEISKKPVEEVMEDAFPMVSEDTPLSMISGLLQFEPAILVSKKGRVSGIITKADLLKVIGA